MSVRGKEMLSEERRYARAILAFMFLTGICSFGYEVVMERSIVIILGSSSVAMGLIISTFILGYLSTFYFGRSADRIGSERKMVVLLATLESVIGVFILLSVLITRFSPLLADGLSYLIFFYYLDYYYVLLITLGLISLVVPLLMGAEIPLAIKLMAGLRKGDESDIYDNMGRITGAIFTFDSLGAGAGGFLTALVLIPYLGKNFSALLLSVVTLVSGIMLYLAHIRYSGGKRSSSKRRAWYSGTLPYGAGVVALVIMLMIAVNAASIENTAIKRLYGGEAILHKESDYQEIVIVEHPLVGTTLYLNGQLQISDMDDQMYHEFLVHPALTSHPSPERILVIGGGDGGAVEEVLKHDVVKEVVFVELDREVIEISVEYLREINHGCFDDPRVSVKITDGRIFVRDYEGDKFDVVVGDLPDPDTEAVAMLYTREFFRDVKGVLREDGIFVLQSASWFDYPEVTMSISKTLETVFPRVDIYLNDVWTFGPWSFTAASEAPYMTQTEGAQINATLERRTVDTLYYNRYTHRASLLMANNPYLEKAEKKAKISTLDRPVLQNPWK